MIQNNGKFLEKRNNMSYNYKLTIGYDGARYQGWQRNKNANETIQSRLEKTLSKLLEEEIHIIGSGRTDKGTHAIGQIANFKTTIRHKSNSLKYQINRVLPDDIIILDVHKVDVDFNSQFAAESKTYRYTLWKANAERLPLFERKFVSLLEEQVDVDLMIIAAQKFLGKHDFKGFSSDKTKKSTIRTIHSLDIIEDENQIEIVVNGNGFLYNMVRIIVGTLVEIGLEERHDDTIDQVFESKQRAEAGYTAAAKGLCLVEVCY